jgi:hypothetical protein
MRLYATDEYTTGTQSVEMHYKNNNAEEERQASLSFNRNVSVMAPPRIGFSAPNDLGVGWRSNRPTTCSYTEIVG